jgi:hypothetical protein
VFFDSAVALVPQDTNDVRDVYEWERDGSGSCRESPGCQYLLSGGANASESFLLDASANGSDVFFGSRAQLVREDNDEDFNVYDARIGGVQPVSPPACTGAGCQGVPPAPPIFATPSSVTFNGTGNFPPTAPVVVKHPVKKKAAKCAKGKTRDKHGQCIKNKKSKKAKKTKRAGNDRRAPR